MAKMDKELVAIQRVGKALAGLSSGERQRVLSFVGQREYDAAREAELKRVSREYDPVGGIGSTRGMLNGPSKALDTIGESLAHVG